ncbi:LacI family DNA-binding transcriptional regulator [Glaciimonas sp. PAMC28666]|uniref:LacI family DNA-binding transcriptional regulator n=1 Tax=Glaciimonas sp. PAMC28666 TaxID=2807626 RepID=UPI00196417BC|nr:LacI family DNA-binding transcriptional regulator [Glaciimonas sp. PAMC28666]QRX84164.1 LacI family DNA-binding transcriptional regulator [Glaciimonas sp. PAMC28666]
MTKKTTEIISSGLARTTTINDVAREAQVGKTSVSRYLNGEMDALSEELRKRIARAIHKLDFRPNQMARGLKRGRTRLVGMVVADITNPYSVEVMRGVEAACQQHGYMLMLCNSANELKLEQRYLELLTNYRVDGLVVNPIALPEEDLALITRTGVPVVLIDRRASRIKCDMVGLDNDQAATLATQHLLDQGYTAIHFLTEPIGLISSRQERQHAMRMLVEASAGKCSSVTSEVDLRQAESLDAALRLCLATSVTQRTAILASNGRMLLRVALALRELGAEWPKDLGLLGFDDPEWAGLAGADISSIRQPTFDIGHAAVEFLIQRIEGATTAARVLSFPGELKIRGSSLNPISRKKP